MVLYTDVADDDERPDELYGLGVVQYDEQQKVWVAEIDWNAIRHASSDQRGRRIR